MAFRLTETPLDHGVRVEVAGELDIASAPELEAELVGRLADPACREIVLDLTQVTFIDSSGLRSLLLGEREATASGSRLQIIPGTGQVLRVIELADVADRLNLVRG